MVKVKIHECEFSGKIVAEFRDSEPVINPETGKSTGTRYGSGMTVWENRCICKKVHYSVSHWDNRAVSKGSVDLGEMRGLRIRTPSEEPEPVSKPVVEKQPKKSTKRKITRGPRTPREQKPAEDKPNKIVKKRVKPSVKREAP